MRLGETVAVVAALSIVLSGVGATVGGPTAAGTDDQVSAAAPLATNTTAGASSSEPPPLALTQRTLGNVFRADETVRIGVETTAPRVRWAVRDYRAQRVAGGTAAVDGNRTLTLPVEDVGHYTLRVHTIAGPDSSASSRRANATQTTLAVLPADDFDNDDDFFGMSTQFNAGWDHDLMGTMDTVGVASVREDTGWAAIERTLGEYDFSSPDGYMKPLDARGFDRLAILAYGNPLYDPAGGEYFAIPHTDGYRAAFANFSRATVDHYDGVDTVEVWNEPNLQTYAAGPAGTDPEAYAALLEATYLAAKDARENVTVLGGAAAARHGNETVRRVDTEWWEGVLAAGGAQHMDALSIHLYRDEPTNFRSDLAALRSTVREHNDWEPLPVWVTELGWHTAPFYPGGDRERTQVRNLVRSHARLQAAGVERLYWYTFQDSAFRAETSPQTDEGGVQGGLVRRHDDPRGAHTPKPGLVAYAVMTRQLAGTEFVAVESAAPVESYLFADGDEQTRVLWADERTDVTVETDDPVVVTTVTGEETRLVPTDGAVYLTVGRDPLYLAGDAASVTEGVPVSVSGPVTSGAGAENLTVGVTADRTARTVTHRVGNATVTVTADPGERATRTLPVPDAFGGHAGTAVDVVSVDGRPVGRLTARVGAPTARFGAPAEISGITVETKNLSAGWFTEGNDVGTRYSAFEVGDRAGRSCWESDLSAGSPGNALFLDVPDGHVDGADRPLHLTVTYVDADGAEVGVQYDGPADGADWGGSVTTGGTGEWRSHTFELPGARFADGLGAGHDARLVFDGGAEDVCIGAVTVGTEPAAPLPVPPGVDGTETPTSEPTATASDGSAAPGGGQGTTSEGERPSGDGDVSTPTAVTGSEPADGTGFTAVATLLVVVALTLVGRWRRPGQ